MSSRQLLRCRSCSTYDQAVFELVEGVPATDDWQADRWGSTCSAKGRGDGLRSSHVPALSRNSQVGMHSMRSRTDLHSKRAKAATLHDCGCHVA
jgi:hypothetical protein